MQKERPRQKRQKGESLCKMGVVDIIAREKKKKKKEYSRTFQKRRSFPNPMTLDNGLGPFALSDDGHTQTTVRTL